MRLWFYLLAIPAVLIFIVMMFGSSLRKKDMVVLSIVVVVGIGGAFIPWIYWNHQFEQSSKIALMKMSAQ